MSFDAALGCMIILAAVALLVGLTLWNRRIIERISRRGPTSARQIIKEMDRRER